jgi:hypothetical protein
MTPVGLAELADKAAIHAGIKSFLPDDLQGRLTVLDFAFEASEYPALVGKRFQVMLVDYSPDHIPLLSKRDGEGIKAAAIYVRREGQTEEATHDELQRLINARIETRYSTSEEITLKQHIEQLKVLFSELPGRNLFSNLFRTFASLGEPMGEETDTFSAFMKRAVQIKKSIILREIGATPETLKAFRLVDQMTARPTEGAH